MLRAAALPVQLLNIAVFGLVLHRACPNLEELDTRKTSSYQIFWTPTKSLYCRACLDSAILWPQNQHLQRHQLAVAAHFPHEQQGVP